VRDNLAFSLIRETIFLKFVNLNSDIFSTFLTSFANVIIILSAFLISSLEKFFNEHPEACFTVFLGEGDFELDEDFLADFLAGFFTVFLGEGDFELDEDFLADFLGEDDFILSDDEDFTFLDATALAKSKTNLSFNSCLCLSPDRAAFFHSCLALVNSSSFEKLPSFIIFKSFA
jgi:hypothetical protein